MAATFFMFSSGYMFLPYKRDVLKMQVGTSRQLKINARCSFIEWDLPATSHNLESWRDPHVTSGHCTFALSTRSYFKGRVYIEIILEIQARFYFWGRSYFLDKHGRNEISAVTISKIAEFIKVAFN